MKVKELIEELQAYDQELEVIIDSPYESRSFLEVEYINEVFHYRTKYDLKRDDISILYKNFEKYSTYIKDIYIEEDDIKYPIIKSLYIGYHL